MRKAVQACADCQGGQGAGSAGLTGRAGARERKVPPLPGCSKDLTPAWVSLSLGSPPRILLSDLRGRRKFVP